MIESASDVAGPPNIPASTRADISATSGVGWPVRSASIRMGASIASCGASPPSAVPTTRPPIATASALLRSNRSRKVEPANPASAAAKV